MEGPTLVFGAGWLGTQWARRLGATLRKTDIADAEAVRDLVAQAEKMCFVLDAIQRPQEVTRRTTLNGSALDA